MSFYSSESSRLCDLIDLHEEFMIPIYISSVLIGIDTIR